MMKKQYISYFLFFLALNILGNTSLYADNILKILEGYGRDSLATFSTQGAQAEAARVFNLLLQPDGKLAVANAEQQLNTMQSPVMKSYLCVMLADYAFVNNNFDVGLRYMKRAVDEHDPIRNDSYYRLVLSRAQNMIVESTGKTDEHKNSILTPFSPAAIIDKSAPVAVIPVKISTTETAIQTPKQQERPMETAVDTVMDIPVDTAAISEENTIVPIIEKPINFRIQIGAYSIKTSAMQKQAYFEKQGFLVEVETREGASSTLYIVRIGAYEAYDEAKRALSEFKTNYPSEDGIVIQVVKK